jgi:hypothetical protein
VGHTPDIAVKVARWLPENLTGLVIGRNSRFWVHELTNEELEMICGVEYRALRVLSYLVPAVRDPAGNWSGTLADMGSTLHCAR